ncbi:MAG TPA: cellulose binding domain-containing protein, partial [Polyangiaceae bacterium]
PYPEFLQENSGAGVLGDILSEQRYIKTQFVSLDDGPTTLGVDFHLITEFLAGVTFPGNFALNIDPATGVVTPGALPFGACGFRHDGMELGECAAAHDCSSPNERPECSQECVFFPGEWELCYEVTRGPILSDATCDGVDDDGDGSVDEEWVPSGDERCADRCNSPGTATCESGSVKIVCTDRDACDFDGDGLPDSWEIDGVDGDADGVVDLTLPDADPEHKDLYIEMDAMACLSGIGCEDGAHDHMPALSHIQEVLDAFANAPVPNPDGTEGIRLHFERSDRVPHVDLCIDSCFADTRGDFFGSPEQRQKDADGKRPDGSHDPGTAVLAAKARAYRYTLWGHDDPGLNGWNGGPNIFMAVWESLDNPNSNPHFASAVLMHELGHSLGLAHGGDEEVEYKPNYLSVMNHAYGGGLMPLDFSGGGRLPLDEVFGPSEADGIRDPMSPYVARWACPLAERHDLAGTGEASGPLDWNCDGDVVDQQLANVDLNNDRFCIVSAEDAPLRSTASGDDRRLGGALRPGADGKLYSAYPCGGIAGTDVLVTENDGEIVRPGADGTLETQVCYGGTLQDDAVVNKLVNPAGIERANVDEVNDELILQNNLLVEVRPGPDDELQSSAVNALEVPYLLRSGPDGVIDSKYVSQGVHADDTWVMAGTSSDGEIRPAAGAAVQTQSIGDDEKVDEYIVDGTNRKCESTLSTPPPNDTTPWDSLNNATPRPLGSEQVRVLSDHNDWLALKYAVPSNGGGNSRVPEPPRDVFIRAGRAQSRADLALTLVASADQTEGGSNVSFRVTLTNLGPSEAFEGSVELRLPPGKAFDSCSSAEAACGVAAGRARLDVDSLTAGAEVTAEFVVRTSCADANSALALAARVSSLSFDPNPANDTAQASAEIRAAAPVFSYVPADVTTTLCNAVALGAPAVTDRCGSGVTLTNNAPATFNLGRTLVTWTATLQNGAVATATQAVNATLGDSVSCCPAGSNVIVGTSNNDTLNGTSGIDCILGRGGQDRVYGNGGDDAISGGGGDDIMDGGNGNDRVFGGSGQDDLTGGSGNDLLEGNDGDDVGRGGLGNDNLGGGLGQDQLFGDDNDDTLRGDVGSDTLNGGNGNDYVEGGFGSDTCRGGSGVNRFVSCETKPDAPSAVDACTNAVLDGAETALDCGGTGCLRCYGGLSCTSARDCASSVCAAGTCAPTAAPFQATLFVTSDWGTGYCATVSATNSSASPTTGWRMTIDTKQSAIYQTTKATFTPASGIVAGVPLSSEAAIAAHTTNNQISFCANRTGGNTTALPALTAVTASF